jgi:hypothetical protein
MISSVEGEFGMSGSWKLGGVQAPPCQQRCGKGKPPTWLFETIAVKDNIYGERKLLSKRAAPFSRHSFAIGNN